MRLPTSPAGSPRRSRPGPAGSARSRPPGGGLGHRLADADPGRPLQERLEELFATLGFQPRARPVGADAVCFELGNCPYRSAVRANQPVVCTLHRGLTQGLLDELAPRASLRAFVPKDPDRAGCLIEIEGGISATVTNPKEPF